jgi:prepilin-type N-terminal cleavage/methylation domain-containing protein
MPRYPFSAMRVLTRRFAAQAGYSLVELMTVLGVVGIIMAIAAPSISNHIALQQIRGAGREVVTVLRESREAAMNEGAPRYVLFTPPSTYQVWRFDGSEWVAQTPQTDLGGSVSFSLADVTFPALPDEPVTGKPGVPEEAAYFDTRGRYPYNPAAPSSYSITLRGGLGRILTLTVHETTGQVTGL